MKYIEKFGEYVAYIGGLFLIGFIPIMTIVAIVTADIQPGAWMKASALIASYVIGAFVATLFVLGFRPKDENGV